MVSWCAREVRKAEFKIIDGHATHLFYVYCCICTVLSCIANRAILVHLRVSATIYANASREATPLASFSHGIRNDGYRSYPISIVRKRQIKVWTLL